MRLWRRWQSEKSDEPELDPLHGVHEPAGLLSNLPSGGIQTDKNKKAQTIDPRIRSNLDDRFIKDDGTLNWPANDGVDGPEASLVLQPGQIVDKYGFVSGHYLSPADTPFEARALPYDRARTPLQIFRVKKPLLVQRSGIAPWFGEPGGGTQFRTQDDIGVLKDEYLEPLGRKE